MAEAENSDAPSLSIRGALKAAIDHDYEDVIVIQTVGLHLQGSCQGRDAIQTTAFPRSVVATRAAVFMETL